ncbi:toll-like receptor 13, partial [Silurus asotus]
CKDVSNVGMDLASVPPQIEFLCLELAENLTLHPYSFSRFQKLKQLQIVGSNFALLPGTFKNLWSLQTLELYCKYFFSFFISTETLSDLQNITTFRLFSCGLLSLEIDAFKEFTKLERLEFDENIEDLSDLLCRLAFVSSSLTSLLYSATSAIIRKPNCTFPNGTTFNVKELHGIQQVELYFENVTIVDKTGIKYFRNISNLLIHFRDLKNVKSELKKVDWLRLQLFKERVNSTDKICETARELSSTKLSIQFLNIDDSSALVLDKCVQLEYFDLSSDYYQIKINITFINVLRNLISLRVVWLVTPESRNRDDRALALCENQSGLDTKLKRLYLNTNYFRTLSSRHFSCLRVLEELKWMHSSIEHIEDFSFANTSLLKSLDLSFNQISHLTKYTFFGLWNLQTLQMNDNKLLVVESTCLLYLTSVEFVSLGNFQYTSSECLTIQVNLSIPDNLTQLNISSGIKPMSLTLSNSRESEVGLSLYVWGQAITLQDCNNTFFKSIVQLTAETEQLLCGQSFPARFLKSLRHFTIKANRKTAQMDLTDLNQLVHLKSLILFNVDLSYQSGLSGIFHNLSNLEYLHMTYCSVPLLEKDLTKDLRSVKVLVFHNDYAFSIMENFVEPLKSLRYLIIQHPLLHCSCDNAWIISWAKYEQSVEVWFPRSSSKILPCKNVDETQLLREYAQDHCFVDVGFLLFVSTSLGLVFFMLVVLFHQLAGDYLMAFLHIARAWVEEAMRANKKGQYNFDVFVSYCGKDEHWVMDELLPNLEKRGPPFLKLCLHSRDFELGKDVVENITNSIYRSRHTLCLVSRNYLRSKWCSLEMRLATYRLLAEHRDVLVLVFLETVPHQLLNVHHRLSRLVKTQTYIDWPQVQALRNAFWDRL